MAANRKTRIATTQYAAVPNQVLLGIPWKTVRPKYEGIVEKLRKTFPISFVIVGRDQNQDAEDFLEVIKKRLQTSSYAIFDGTGVTLTSPWSSVLPRPTTFLAPFIFQSIGLRGACRRRPQ